MQPNNVGFQSNNVSSLSLLCSALPLLSTFVNDHPHVVTISLAAFFTIMSLHHHHSFSPLPWAMTTLLAVKLWFPFVHARRARPCPVFIFTPSWAMTTLPVSVGCHGVGNDAAPWHDCLRYPPASCSGVVLVELSCGVLRSLPLCYLWHDMLPRQHPLCC